MDRQETVSHDYDNAPLVARPPHPRLSRHVGIYLGQDRTHTQPILRRVAALGSITVAIDLDTPSRRMITAEAGMPPPSAAVSPVSGLSDRPMVFEQAGRERGMTVELTPLGAHALFGMPLRELANTRVGLIDLLGARARRLTEQLAEARGWTARFRLLDERLSEWMLDGPRLALPVQAAWQRLITAAGRTTISSLADEVGWTRAHLHARFREQVGLAPKTVARIARLHHAIRLMTKPDPPRWSDIAATCGYTDQPHLNLDFRALTGHAPTDMFTLDGLHGEIFLGGSIDVAIRTPPPPSDRREPGS
ncbi:helix-turn-helix transcriptional regulator [Lentzea albidocapillata]|uniref:AraC-type DNA-binding protein n=1 Tax=Lentzea albidocapillata TaxID=40571 RepID=A0A1W2CXK0_9PSEU|nr:helix-turn-helix transcriptional regulator [Lentzea albidocapillata]SMC89927.1 AraC-type DNA-binding protein [Lentzea albidocapillata]